MEGKTRDKNRKTTKKTKGDILKAQTFSNPIVSIGRR